jgi:hypothetical protein
MARGHPAILSGDGNQVLTERNDRPDAGPKKGQGPRFAPAVPAIGSTRAQYQAVMLIPVQINAQHLDHGPASDTPQRRGGS